ncbi:PLAC8 family protein [Annulohypoxylon nitens]|nr:PLAC8 family protein [Annulohypoxylon nitens]
MAVREIKGGDWQNGLFGCCSPCDSCLLGIFAPCLLIGRASSRMRDPGSPSPELCNSDCMIHGCLTVFFNGWIYSFMKRKEIRERFEIEGSGCGDCCAAFWCQYCQIIQADKEVKARLTTGPINQGYQATDGMKMPQH